MIDTVCVDLGLLHGGICLPLGTDRVRSVQSARFPVQIYYHKLVEPRTDHNNRRLSPEIWIKRENQFVALFFARQAFVWILSCVISITSLRKGRGENRVMKVIDSPMIPESDAEFALSDGGICDPE